MEKISGLPVNPDEPGKAENTPQKSVPGSFYVTGIQPYYLDFHTQYPVLAMYFRYTHIAYMRRDRQQHGLEEENILSDRKGYYSKETFFLIADREDKFEWVTPADSSYYLPGLVKNDYPEHSPGHNLRFGITKDTGGYKNMIYPVRPFSITGISMEGFDAQKEYAVLAIDIDQIIADNQAQDEDEAPEPQAGTQTLAFFLVGDDNGEFTWIAEDECRLAPLK